MLNFDPTTVKTIDDKMAEIADIIPGFAGYYLEPKDPKILESEITDIETALQISNNMLPIIRMTNSEQVTSRI